MGTDASLRRFGELIQRGLRGDGLTRSECRAAFREILLNEQPDLHQGAFLAALTAKGATPEEIAGVWEAILELDTVRVDIPLDEPLVENCGTGMDRLKTFNISSAAAVVAAAGGAYVARHGARGLTSACGTVDLLEAVGIGVDCDVDTVAQSIRRCGIGLFNGASARVHPRALFRILSQIRFGSILNIAASLASPCRPSHAVRGVYSAGLLPAVCRVMRAIGYQRALVVHGFDGGGADGMDELSTIGESAVQEFYPDGREERYTLAPEDVGLRRAAYAEVAATGDLGQEAARFLDVLAGTAAPACIDITCLNAAAVLYVAGKVADLKSGVARCREIIHSGRAMAKLRQWAAVQRGEGSPPVDAPLERAGRDGRPGLAFSPRR